MAFFKKKSKKKQLEEAAKKARKAKLEELKKLIERKSLTIPKKEKFTTKPIEYTEFLKEIKSKPTTLYEKATKFAEKLNVSPSKPEAKKMEENIKAGYLSASPTGVLSLTILSILFFVLISAIAFLLKFTTFSFICFLFGMTFSYLIYNHPSSNAKRITMRMSADAILAILYMIIYMRASPNLEGAIKFASETLTGPLSWDLKKLVWDINLGVHTSADAALSSYTERWKEKNKEFAEALNLLRETSVSPSRREKLFDETLNVILEGTTERTKRYVRGLLMPVMLIHAMGVLLPVMGLVLFPIIIIFMADVVKPAFLFIGYDILLPIFLWFLINHILSFRSSTFSQPDISLVKGIPPLGKFKFREKTLPILPVVIAAMIPLFIIGLLGLKSESLFTSVNSSLLLVCAFAIGIILYCYLDCHGKIKVRNDIEKIEDEFSVALFQLGNQISSGVPIEAAVDRTRANLKGMKIAEMFAIASSNMKKFGYTFEQSLFDSKIGAIWWYPSNIIKSIMSTIVQASKKGLKNASNAMLTISRYLRGVHEVKETLSRLLGETISSMQFLAMFLAPMVAGVTITMAIVIIQILSQMGAQMSEITAGADVTAAQSMLVVPWAMAGGMPISPQMFQIVVGIYMLETAILLSMFINRLEYGEDAIGLRKVTGNVLLTAMIVYVLSWVITYSLFGSSITTLLTPGV